MSNMGKKPVSQRYALWVQRLIDEFKCGRSFTLKDAMSTVAKKHNTTYYPSARQMSQALRGNKRFQSSETLNNGLKVRSVVVDTKEEEVTT